MLTVHSYENCSVPFIWSLIYPLFYQDSAIEMQSLFFQGVQAKMAAQKVTNITMFCQAMTILSEPLKED